MVVEVGRGISHDRLLTITQAIDRILVDRKMQPYYKDPRFHITLFTVEQKEQKIELEERKIPANM